MVRTKRLRTLVCALTVGVVVPVTAAPANAVDEEVAPAPVAESVRTSLDAAKPAAAPGCVGRSRDPFLASLGNATGINTGVAARVNTDCNLPVNRMVTTVRLWRYHGSHGGWHVIAAATVDSGVWPGLKHQLAKLKKPCHSFRSGAWYQVTGVHTIYYRDGGVGRGESGSPVKRLGCLA